MAPNPPQPDELPPPCRDILLEYSNQLITNDNFVSSRHKVMANKTADPRISVASFFMRYLTDAPNVLAPIKELLSEDNPAKYRGTTEKEFSIYFHQKGLDETSALSHFKI
ncbi:hypothetical protein L2E82_45330 [Cichorium intybus]|uniref:Uncharacterized protein n=2 Tax=Cichorium intybus TaxID=13427 RepID=A0ACB8ZRY2_CICIN|nr:hypothetical protein L2E82_45212 [Cichorium intybus]KAI3700693.1 hypothetical protein L2E82_45330 [Cichorium intybus]